MYFALKLNHITKGINFTAVDFYSYLTFPRDTWLGSKFIHLLCYGSRIACVIFSILISSDVSQRVQFGETFSFIRWNVLFKQGILLRESFTFFCLISLWKVLFTPFKTIQLISNRELLIYRFSNLSNYTIWRNKMTWKQGNYIISVMFIRFCSVPLSFEHVSVSAGVSLRFEMRS